MAAQAVSSASSLVAAKTVSFSKSFAPRLQSKPSHATPRPARSLRVRAAAPESTQEEVLDSKIGEYCAINKKEDKKSLGELENDFLEALQSYYYDEKPMMTNEEFDKLKEELTWQGSGVVVLSTQEQKFLEAARAYAAGKPIMSDAEYDELKAELKKKDSPLTMQGPRCSLRSREVYSDTSVDYLRMVAINVPGAVLALGALFLVDDASGFGITYLLELPEPWGALTLYGAVFPVVYFLSQKLTSIVLKDPLVLKGPCPNCGHNNVSFFGSIFGISAGSTVNAVACDSCGAQLEYELDRRAIVLKGLKPPAPPPKAPAAKGKKAAKKAD